MSLAQQSSNSIVNVKSQRSYVASTKGRRHTLETNVVSDSEKHLRQLKIDKHNTKPSFIFQTKPTINKFHINSGLCGIMLATEFQLKVL